MVSRRPPNCDLGTPAYQRKPSSHLQVSQKIHTHTHTHSHKPTPTNTLSAPCAAAAPSHTHTHLTATNTLSAPPAPPPHPYRMSMSDADMTLPRQSEAPIGTGSRPPPPPGPTLALTAQRDPRSASAGMVGTRRQTHTYMWHMCACSYGVSKNTLGDETHRIRHCTGAQPSLRHRNRRDGVRHLRSPGQDRHAF